MKICIKWILECFFTTQNSRKMRSFCIYLSKNTKGAKIWWIHAFWHTLMSLLRSIVSLRVITNSPHYFIAWSTRHYSITSARKIWVSTWHFRRHFYSDWSIYSTVWVKKHRHDPLILAVKKSSIRARDHL